MSENAIWVENKLFLPYIIFRDEALLLCYFILSLYIPHVLFPRYIRWNNDKIGLIFKPILNSNTIIIMGIQFVFKNATFSSDEASYNLGSSQHESYIHISNAIWFVF